MTPLEAAKAALADMGRPELARSLHLDDDGAMGVRGMAMADPVDRRLVFRAWTLAGEIGGADEPPICCFDCFHLVAALHCEHDDRKSLCVRGVNDDLLPGVPAVDCEAFG